MRLTPGAYVGRTSATGNGRRRPSAGCPPARHAERILSTPEDPYDHLFAPAAEPTAVPAAVPAPLPAELSPRGSRAARAASARSDGSGSARPESVRSKGRGARIASRAAAAAAALVLLSSTVGYGLVHHYLGQIDQIDAFAGLTNRPAAQSDSLNILLVGSDSRDKLSRAQQDALHTGSAVGQRSDTMMLVHINAAADHATVVSLPRDSLVTIPAHLAADGTQVPARQNKLNAAYSFGGASLLIKTIETATGLRIDHYIEIGFTGVITMTDAVGGVNVCMPKSVNDKNSGLVLPAGRSHIGGDQALAFVRAREFDLTADIGRIGRQQQFLSALFQRATSTGVLLNPVALNGLLSSAFSAITTDNGLDENSMISLAYRLRGINGRNITFVTVPVADGNHTVAGLGSTLLWDSTKAGRLWQAIKDDIPVGKNGAPVTSSSANPSAATLTVTVPANQVRVVVLNGAGVAGLARRAAADLAAVGFRSGGAPRNFGTGATTTVIRYDPTLAKQLPTVLAAIPGAAAAPATGLGSAFQVIVGSGYSKAGAVTLGAAVPVPAAPVSSSSNAAAPVKARTAVDDVCAG